MLIVTGWWDSKVVSIDNEFRVHNLISRPKYCYGITQGKTRVFVYFGSWPPNPHDKDQSIRSYQIEGQSLVNERIEVYGVPQCIHQMKYKDGYLWYTDTAWQKISRYRVDDQDHVIPESLEEFTPFPQCVTHYYQEFSHLNKGEYRHINSLTFYGDKCYVMCPFRVSKIRDEFDETKYSELVELDSNLNILRTIQLPYKGCHDILFTEPDVFWTCAYDCLLVRLNMKTLEILDRIELSKPNFRGTLYNRCRGLALVDGKIYVGVDDTVQIVDNGKVTQVIKIGSTVSQIFLAREPTPTK